MANNFWDDENQEDELDVLAQNTLYPEAEQRATQSLQNEIQAESQPVFVPEMVEEVASEAPAVSPEIERMDRMQGLLAELQKQRADRQQSLNIGRGANQIAQAFAAGRGAKIGTGNETLDAIQGTLDQPIKDYKDRIDNEMDEPTSDVSKFYREQAYAVLKRVAPNTNYDGKLENMSANQLLKLPGLKNALGAPARTRQQSQFVSKINGDPVDYDPNSGEYRNAITGQKIASGELVRPVYVNDAFGNRIAISPSGNVTVASSKRPDITPEQMNKQADEKGFKPDEKQREALDKEKGRIDTLTKNVNEKLGSASRILAALDGDSKQAMAVIKTQMPRLAGEVGNLNQSEQEVWGGSQAWLDRAMQFLERGADSELTEDNKRELRKILGIFLKEAESSRQSIMNNSIESLAQIHNIPPSFSQKVYPSIKTLSPRQQEVVEGNVDAPGKSKAAKGMVRFQDSNGKIHDIPETNLEAAKKRDPGLKVIK